MRRAVQEGLEKRDRTRGTGQEGLNKMDRSGGSRQEGQDKMDGTRGTRQEELYVLGQEGLNFTFQKIGSGSATLRGVLYSVHCTALKRKSSSCHLFCQQCLPQVILYNNVQRMTPKTHDSYQRRALQVTAVSFSLISFQTINIFQLEISYNLQSLLTLNL